MLNHKSILITGGTGSLGKALINHILNKYPNVESITVLSRDEQKQFQLSQAYPTNSYPQIKFLIGDVRDLNRLVDAFKDIHVVIHAAAMKYVPIAEENPMECIKTNILGAENVIRASIQNRVERVVSLSTDKAAAPISLYGASKLASDKLFVASNTSFGNHNTIFSVVRYGNVMGSRGSVIPFFLKCKKEKGVLPITDPNMTRFNISLQDGIQMVMHALENALGGEIFIPKISSFRITDLAMAIAPDCRTEIIGIRPGEKIHEDMITESDAFYTYDLGKYYTIVPAIRNWSLEDFKIRFKGKKVDPQFSYNSSNNDCWETVETLRDLIVKNVDPDFKV